MKNTQKAAAPAKATEEKAKRKQLTPAERVAKLEADLAAAREKAAAKEGKARATALDKRAKLVARRDDLQKQIDAIDAEFPPADAEATDTTDDQS